MSLLITDNNSSTTTAEIDTLNQRVGLGGITPAYTLDVAGQTQITYEAPAATSTTIIAATGPTGSYALDGSTG